MLLAEHPELLPAEAEMSRMTFSAHRRVQTAAFVRFWADVVGATKSRQQQLVMS
jgi:hypothetical protein